MAWGREGRDLEPCKLTLGSVASNFITSEGLTENLAALRDTCPVMVFEGTKLDILMWEPVLHLCKNKTKQKHPNGKNTALEPMLQQSCFLGLNPDCVCEGRYLRAPLCQLAPLLGGAGTC